MKNIGLVPVNQSGFTLIEMLVSLSIFTMVIVASVGTLLVIVTANSNAQSSQLVMTNLTFALDSMVRELRTGDNWYCHTSISGSVPAEDAQRDCGGSGGGRLISVHELSERLTEAETNHRITYFLDNGRLYRKLGGGSLNSGREAMTSDEVEITRFTIYASYTDPDDAYQPFAVITVEGVAGDQGVNGRSRDFQIQTTVTQNVLDLP